MVLALSIVLCLLYAALVCAYGLYFARQDGRRGVLRGLLVLVLLCHLGFVLLLAMGPRGPLVYTFSGGLSSLALALTFAYFLIEWISRERNMGVWVLALPLAFHGAATVRIASEAPGVLPQTPLLLVHILTALVGYCAFSLSAVFSVMYLAQYRQIKSRRLGMLFERLPALEKTESMGYRAVHFGLGFLALGILLGEWLYYGQEGRLVVLDFKILAALVACGVYGAAIVLRGPLSIRGKRFAVVSIAGFALILFSLFFIDNLMSGFHQF